MATGEVELDGDPRSSEVRELLGRIDRSTLRGGTPHPDMFIYEFDLAGHRAVVPEQHLTAELRRLVELVLGGGSR